MRNIRKNRVRRGFTLVEMMVGLTLFGLVMSGVMSTIQLSMIISETSIYENAAKTVAQGYLEQIKSIPYEEALLSAQDPENYPIKTINPTYDKLLNSVVVADYLSVASTKQPTKKEIIIDSRGENNDTLVKMPMNLWTSLKDLNTGSKPVNALEIKIEYKYQLPKSLGGNWKSYQIQSIRARM